MNSKSKAKCYRDIYAGLKNKAEVTNLGFPPQEQRKHYDLFFDIGGLHADYRLRSDTDLLLIRVSRDIPDWVDEADAREFCKNELNCNKYRWFAENGKLSGSYTLPLSDLSEENAQKEATRGAENFIQYLIANKDKMETFFENPALDAPDRERSDFEKFCSTQIAEIERRQQLVKKMEDAVDDKIADYQQKNDALIQQKAEVLAMKEQNEKDSADIAERISLTQELQNKEQMIVILQENIAAKEKEMKRGSFFSGILPDTDAVDREKHEDCVKALRDSEQAVQNLQAEVSRLTSENKKIRRLYDGVQSTTEKRKKEQEKWEEQVKQMELQLSDARNRISDLEAKLEQAHMETVTPVDLEGFEDAGFSVKEIVGEKEGLYRLEASTIPDGLTVVIDTIHRFALLQKTVRRGKKYMRTIQEWNTDDLHSSYILDNNLLIVKKYLYNDDAVSDLREVIRRIEDLR